MAERTETQTLEETVGHIHTLAESARQVINRIIPDLNMLDEITCDLSELHKLAIEQGKQPFDTPLRSGDVGVDSEGVEYRIERLCHGLSKVASSGNPLAGLANPDNFRRKACGAAPKPPVLEDYIATASIRGVMLNTKGRPTTQASAVIHAELTPKYPAKQEENNG